MKLLALSMMMLLPGLASADWPQFLGPTRDGVSAETNLQFTWSAKGPVPVWERPVGDGFSGPVISGGRLILFQRLGEEEVVECLDARTGKTTWKFAYPTQFRDDFGKGDGPRSTPVMTGRNVVTLGADGWLHCLELETGKAVWKRNIVKEYKVPGSFFGVGSSPIVAGNLLLVNVGSKSAGIVAFALDSGKEAWKATADGASYSSPVVTEVDGVRHAVFFTREGVVVLDPNTGSVRFKKGWRARIDASVNAATPLVFGDKVFISSSYDTGALLLRLTKTGAEELWQSEEVMSNHYNTCVYYKGHLYGFDGRQETGASFRCVDLATKTVKWNKARFGCGSMILADGHLLVLLESGELLAVEVTPEGYREKSRARILSAGPCRAQIALADARLFARDRTRLVCFNLSK